MYTYKVYIGRRDYTFITVDAVSHQVVERGNTSTLILYDGEANEIARFNNPRGWIQEGDRT